MSAFSITSEDLRVQFSFPTTYLKKGDLEDYSKTYMLSNTCKHCMAGHLLLLLLREQAGSVGFVSGFVFHHEVEFPLGKISKVCYHHLSPIVQNEMEEDGL